jgi:demethylmenaquinone methyltransferase / 2-methoxy-6-polyprenyl-1,4-benzoquinol methylase
MAFDAAVHGSPRQCDQMSKVQAVDPNRFARQLFDGLPGRYDLLAEVLSFGQNGRWRRAMVGAVAASALPSPGRVLDVATGTAGVALQLARRTGAHVTGVDLTPQMLRTGAARVAKGTRLYLALARGEQLPFADATFDALTFTYLLRYVADPQATLRELARVVKPGGVVASLEFHAPASPVWAPLWRLYTAVGLPAAGFVLGGREWYDVGKFLGPSISTYYRRYPLPWQVSAWEAAGVDNVQARVMSLGGGLVMWGRRPLPRPALQDATGAAPRP